MICPHCGAPEASIIVYAEALARQQWDPEREVWLPNTAGVNVYAVDREQFAWGCCDAELDLANEEEWDLVRDLTSRPPWPDSLEVWT